jgi:hypothetical protein
MKITKSQLKQIIKEELQNVLKEAQQEDWDFPEEEIVVDPRDVGRAGHEGETSDLPGGLIDEPRKHISLGQTRKERADEAYRLQQLAKDIASNIESLVSDPKSDLQDRSALARLAKDLLKLLKKPLETRPDPRQGGAGDYTPPNYPRIVNEEIPE